MVNKGFIKIRFVPSIWEVMRTLDSKRSYRCNYLIPRTIVAAGTVAAGTYASLTGLAEIVQDIITKNPVETPDKVVTAFGAGLVIYGLSLLTDHYYKVTK